MLGDILSCHNGWWEEGIMCTVHRTAHNTMPIVPTVTEKETKAQKLKNSSHIPQLTSSHSAASP